MQKLYLVKFKSAVFALFNFLIKINKFIVFSICYEIAKNRINQLDTLIKNEKINGRLKNNRTNTANNVLKL